MPENESNHCEFVSKDLVLRLDMDLVGDIHAIDPAVRESLANAIVHGCQQDRERTVKISVGCDEARGMIIVVRDPGRGFDPSKLPSPVEGEQLFSESGRGIFLINRLMDEVRFRKGGAEIWMRKG